MKKTIVLIAMLAFCGLTWADDKISIEDVTVPQGGKTALNVIYHFDVEGAYTSYQFDIDLPEGVELEMNGNNVVYTLGDCHTSTHMLATNYVTAEDVYAFASLSMQSDPLSGTDGVLMTLQVTADASLEIGSTLTGTIQAVDVNTLRGTRVPLSNQTFTITIGAPVDPRTILNELSETVPTASSGPVDILVKRNINANQWTTICLPFDMTEQQVYDAFGDDVQLKEFDSYDVVKDDETGDVFQIIVKFIGANLAADGFLANYPYLIKTSRDISEFEVNSTIDPDEENAVAEYAEGRGARRHVYGTLYGTYHAKTVVPANCLFISENKFWYSIGATKMKAFRAYFELEDILSLSSDASSNISMIFDETTGINNAAVSAVDERSGYFTLDGRKLSGVPSKKGVYIVNGQKIVIK